MRKILVFVLCAALLLPGCQKAPKREQPAPLQLDMAQMIQTAQKENPITSTPNMSLAERFKIPARYTNSFEDEGGKLKINVNADIALPQVNVLPMVRVEAADFTQEQVDRFFKLFCGGHEMYECPDIMTKSELDIQISGLRRDMENHEIGLSDEEKERWLRDIASLEKLRESAPEAVEPARTSGALHETTRYHDLSGKPLYRYWGLNAYSEDNSLSFVVENNNDMKEAFVSHEENGKAMGGYTVRRGARMSFSKQNDYTNAFTDDRFIRVVNQNAVPDAAKSSLTLTPAKAKLMASELLKDTGMAVQDVFMFDPSNEKQGRGFYKLLCVRAVSGVPCAYVNGEYHAGAGLLSPSWCYETLDVYVDDTGVFRFEWHSPLNIVEFVSRDAQFLPFSDIQDIFEKIIIVKNESSARQSEIDAVNIDVSHVTLTMRRIEEYGSIESGFLVPAWNFYGKMANVRNQPQETSVDSDYDAGYESLLTINAIDGSVIDN